MRKKAKICFMGSNNAGVVGALTVIAAGYELSAAVSYSSDLDLILNKLDIPVYKSIQDVGFKNKIKDSDILLCVHGREIVPLGLFQLPRVGALNIHPYLYKYKGASPVERALKDKEYRASVGAHLMSEKVDEGRVILEKFIDVQGSTSAAEVYNFLYPHYSDVVLGSIERIMNEKG